VAPSWFDLRERAYMSASALAIEVEIERTYTHMDHLRLVVSAFI
jgi:hypothetical protein